MCCVSFNDNRCYSFYPKSINNYNFSDLLFSTGLVKKIAVLCLSKALPPSDPRASVGPISIPDDNSICLYIFGEVL